MSIRLGMAVKKLELTSLFMLAVCAAVVISNRSVYVGTDTLTYTNKFINGAACKCLGGSEIGFELFVWPMYMLSFKPASIFFVISLLIYSLLYLAAIKLASVALDGKGLSERAYFKYALTLFAFIAILPITIQIHINAIRQGLSALMLLISFLYLEEKKKRVSVVYLCLAAAFHYSTLLILPFYVFLLYLRWPLNFAYYSAIAVFSALSVVYLTGFSEAFVKTLSEFFHISLWHEVRSYGADSGYRDGVRYDFYIFTLAMMLPTYIYSTFNARARAYFVFLVVSVIPFCC